MTGCRTRSICRHCCLVGDTMDFCLVTPSYVEYVPAVHEEEELGCNKEVWAEVDYEELTRDNNTICCIFCEPDEERHGLNSSQHPCSDNQSFHQIISQASFINHRINYGYVSVDGNQNSALKWLAKRGIRWIPLVTMMAVVGRSHGLRVTANITWKGMYQSESTAAHRSATVTLARI